MNALGTGGWLVIGIVLILLGWLLQSGIVAFLLGIMGWILIVLGIIAVVAGIVGLVNGKKGGAGSY